MASATMIQDGRPPPAEVRAQLQRMTASDVFATRRSSARSCFRRRSGAARAGRSAQGLHDRRRGAAARHDVRSADRSDRAGRRDAAAADDRALLCGPGVDEPVIIDLPRGGYVPRFAGARRASQRPSRSRRSHQPSSRRRPDRRRATACRPARCAVRGRRQPGYPRGLGGSPGGKLGEAFALFETVNVTSGAVPAVRPSAPIAVVPAVPGARSDYRLDGTVEYRGDQTIDIRFKLIDEADATVIWSRAFERLSCLEGRDTVEESILLELATTVVQPFGVVWSHERAKQFATQAGDPRCRALIEAGESFRSFDPAEHESARASLEHLTAADPGFASGFSYLATVYCREHQSASASGRATRRPRPGAHRRPARYRAQAARLTRAPCAVHRAVRARRDRGSPCRRGAGDRAQQIRHDHPHRIRRADDLLRRGRQGNGHPARRRRFRRDPAVVEPFRAVRRAHMRGEMTEARSRRASSTSETYVDGIAARALIAARRRSGRIRSGEGGDSRASAGMGQRSAQGNPQSDHRAGDRGAPCGGFCRGLNVVLRRGTSGISWHVDRYKSRLCSISNVTANFSQSAATSIHRHVNAGWTGFFPLPEIREAPPCTRAIPLTRFARSMLLS